MSKPIIVQPISNNIVTTPSVAKVNILVSGGFSSDGSDITAFTQLSDVPSSYSGQASKLVSVKSDSSGLQFITNNFISNPLTTLGDLIIGGSSGTPTRLPIGANTYVLTSNGTTASWASSSITVPVTSVFTRTGAITAAIGDYDVSQITNALGATNLTNTRIPFATASHTLSDDSNLTWDNSNSVKRLTLGTGTGVVADISIGKLKSIYSTSDTSVFHINAFFQAEQTVASSQGIQGIEGLIKISHNAGTTNLALGTIGNIFLNGTGTIDDARSVGGGGDTLAAGTINNWACFRGQLGNGGGATIVNGYGLYIDTFPAGITNKYGIYIADYTALNYFSGKVQIGSLGSTAVSDDHILAFKSYTTTNDGSVFHIGNFNQVEQTVANPQGIQGIEGYVKCSHPSGDVSLALGTVGNVELSSAGHITLAVSVGAGGLLSGTGTIDEWDNIRITPVDQRSGTISKIVGLKIEAIPAGPAAFNIETTSLNAVNMLRGKLIIPGTPNSSAGLISGSVWYDPADGNRLKYVP